MIYNLHLLRIVAALAVVYYHITGAAGLNLRLCFGKCGVDVFFVISGFIIAYIGSKSPDSFLLRRLMRIVPFYWSATLFIFCVALLMPQLLRQTQPDLPHLLFSLLFIPHETSYSGMFPTLLLGWTLNYEMYFYVLFAIALLVSRRAAPLVCSLLLAIVTVVISGSATESATLRFYSRPIVFEFVFGIAVFYGVDLVGRRANHLHNAVWLKWILYVLAATALVLLATQELYHGFGLPFLLTAGVPAVLLVSSAILIETVYGDKANNRLVFLLGESSYILYLIHPYIIYGVLRLIVGSKTKLGAMYVWAMVPMLMALAAAVALLIHLWFEKPVMDFLRRLLVKKPSGSWRPSRIPLVVDTSRPV
jgi:exopolysaccharide production protein ExoZ